MEFAVLLLAPLTGAIVLGFYGARRWAPEANVGFSLGTFLAACVLTARVLREGNVVAAREQFFIDPFNVFLVVLTAFVGFTTAVFSRPYMRIETGARAHRQGTPAPVPQHVPALHGDDAGCAHHE